jgi:hypothetical protein
MKLWKLILLGLSILCILCSGCMSGSSSSGTGSTAMKAEPTPTTGTTSPSGSNVGVQEVTSQTPSVDENSHVGENVGGKLPPWAEKYLPNDNRGYNYTIFKINTLKSHIVFQGDLIYSNYPNMGAFKAENGEYKVLFWDDATPLLPSQKMFNTFLKVNGIDVFKVLSNETLKKKYEEKYQQYLEISNQALAWEKNHLEGKTYVVIFYPLDVGKYGGYPADTAIIQLCDGEDIAYQLLANGYGFVGPMSLSNYEASKLYNFTETRQYYEHYLKAEEYAKEHKLGVWSIDLSDLK